MKYNVKFWAIGIAAAIAIGFVMGLLLKTQTFNTANTATHFIAPTAVALALASINRQFLSKLAYLLLPLAFCLGQIVAFLGVVVIARQWGIEQGQTLITDILVQYLPPAAGMYLMYVFYSWMAGVRVFWVGLLQLLLGAAVGFLVFNYAEMSPEFLLSLAWGGTAAILPLSHFSANNNNNNNPQPANSNQPEPTTNNTPKKDKPSSNGGTPEQ